MSRDWISGLDDHPETELNPILLFQIKQAKEALRSKKEIEAKLIANGYEPNHLESLSPEAAKALLEELNSTKVVVANNVGSVPGLTRKYGATMNSTRIMVNNGASFVPGAGHQKTGGGDAEAAAAMAVRERLKTVDQHLSTTLHIDISRETVTKVAHRLKAGAQGLGLAQNALEKAKELAYKPFGGEAVRRAEEMSNFAKRGRARVGPPLDHAVQQQQERARRASTMGAQAAGGARRASCMRSGGGPSIAGVAGVRADGEVQEKMRRASTMLGAAK
jgi:hypothetical protein